MFNPGIQDVRHFFCDTWRRHREGLPMEPLQLIALDWLLEHPEYHGDLTDPDARTRQYAPEHGRTNPFLHLALHLAIAEQLSIDQPAGIRHCMQQLVQQRGSAHEAAHAILDCLAETLWEGQRVGRPPDQAAYRQRLFRVAGLPLPDETDTPPH